MDEEKEAEETSHDRRKQYDAMRKGGMSDKEAMEKVWPSTRVGILKNVADKADIAQKKADAEQKKKDGAK